MRFCVTKLYILSPLYNILYKKIAFEIFFFFFFFFLGGGAGASPLNYPIVSIPSFGKVGGAKNAHIVVLYSVAAVALVSRFWHHVM